MARSLPKPHIIYLIRHGESVGNARKIFLEPEHDVLSKAGELQVELLGKYLSKENITRVYSSDYARALQTANAITRHSRNVALLEVKTDVRLRERNIGEFEGKCYREAIDGLLKNGGDLMAFNPEGAEKMKEVGSRMTSFFKFIVTDSAGFTFLNSLDTAFSKKETSIETEGATDCNTFYQMIKRLGKPFGKLSELKYEMGTGACTAADYVQYVNVCLELDQSKLEQEIAVVVSHSFALIKLVDTLTKSGTYQLSHWDQSRGYKLFRNASFIKIAVGSLEDNAEDLSTLPGQRKLDFLNLHETEHLRSLVENDTLVKFTQTSNEAKAFSGCVQT